MSRLAIGDLRCLGSRSSSMQNDISFSQEHKERHSKALKGLGISSQPKSKRRHAFFSSAVNLLTSKTFSSKRTTSLPADSVEQPKRQLSLLCWADVIPKQPEGGPFEGGDKQGAVFVDLKTLSAPLAASSPLSVEPLLPFLSLQGAFPPPLRVVDVRLLGKAGRIASATRVVVRQERLLLPPSPSSAAKGESGERGDSAGARSSSSPSISREALSVVLAGALVEVGAAVLPVGAAAASLFSLPLPVPLCLLRVVAAEPEEGSGAPLRVVRSTRVELL